MSLLRPPELRIPAEDWSRLSPDVQAAIVVIWKRLRAIEIRLAALESLPPPPSEAGPDEMRATAPKWLIGRTAAGETRLDLNHALLWALIGVLIMVSVVPAVLGWRQIANYAALPRVEVAVEREVALGGPNIRPISGAEGVAVTAGGAIFLADHNPRRLLAFPDGTSASGKIIGAEQGPEALREPFDVALGPSDAIYLLDRATGNVNLFGPDGTFERALKLASPGARVLEVDGDGRILIGDSGAHLVRRFLADGQPDPTWGDGTAPGATRVGEVLGLAVTGDRVYATVPGALVLLSNLGRPVGRATLLGNAGALAIAPTGRIYMSDQATNRVWVLQPDGRTVGRVVGPGGDERLFAQPRGLAVTADGHLYVVTENHITVYRLSEESHVG